MFHPKPHPDFRPLPKLKVALVGTGFIVEECHLVAYKKAGIEVCGIMGRDLEKANRVASRFGIPCVAQSVAELLEKANPDILDIAVPPLVQPAVIEEAVKYPKLKGILGTPDRVFASFRKDPRTQFDHVDGINLYILEYENGPRASAWDDVWAGPVKEGGAPSCEIRWRFEGTKGVAKGTIGWPDWPKHTPSTLEYTCLDYPGEWIRPQWGVAWFPDAFVWPMADLMAAIDHGSPLFASGVDNLETIALLEAVLESGTNHRVTTPQSWLKGR